ncbi:MAG: V4R domain-containing protein [Gemmatirosa sp.]
MTARAVTLPRSVVQALRGATLGTDGGEIRLRDAGFDAGRALYDDFSAWMAARAGVADPAIASLAAFGDALGAYATAHGWGTLALEAGDGADTDGQPTLRADDWFEVEPTTDDARAPFPACLFTTGLLAGFLGRLASQPLAVMEIACASCGDGACRFVIGSEAALARLYSSRYGR